MDLNNYRGMGFDSLLDSIQKDIDESEERKKKQGYYFRAPKEYLDKFQWILDRAKNYGDKLGLKWEDILSSWDKGRKYWYMNYYQDCNQPEVNADKVFVFETMGEMLESIGKSGFVCPSCGGISLNPYECDTKKDVNGKLCDWKVYGLFKDLGKGAFVYCKDKLAGETIFMPVAWTTEKTAQ